MFHLYVDEFKNFATGSFEDILSEARKYGLTLILAHQYVSQISEEIRDAVFGNVGSLIVMRVGSRDARLLADEIGWGNPAELQSLQNFHAIGQILQYGNPSTTIRLVTNPPQPVEKTYRSDILLHSRNEWGRERTGVERRIEGFLSRPPETAHRTTLRSRRA
jgi:hypothetical protein